MNSDSVPLLTFLAASTVAAIVLAVFLWRVGRHKSPPAMALDALKEAYLGAGFKLRVSPWHGGAVVNGTIAGSGFKLIAIEGSGRAVTRLMVAGHALSSFDISYEGSRNLDGRDLVVERFAEPRAQEAVRALFAMGFSNVGRGRGGAYAIHFAGGEVPDLPKLETAVRSLATVRDSEVRKK